MRVFRFCLAMKHTSLVALSALIAVGCSRTAPDTQWPPEGPGKLPYIPLPAEDDIFGDSEEPEVDAPNATDHPAAIDAELPTPPKATLSRAATCADKKCELKGFVVAPAKTAPESDANSPAAVWSHAIAKDSVVIIPRHHELECFTLVLEGSVLVSGDDGGPAQALSGWGVARAPGCGVMIRAREGEAKTVIAVATNKESLETSLARAKAKPWEVRWKKRPSALHNFALDKVDDHAWGGGAFHARIGVGGAEPALTASFGLLRASKDGSVAEHDHPTWEHIAVLSGSGRIQIGGASQPVAPGAVFHIPKTVKHGFTTDGKQQLLAVQLYSPSGPEQRFVKLAKEAATADKAKSP